MASKTETNGENSLVHLLDLNEFGLEDVPQQNREVAMQDVADFLLNETLRYLDAGVSPVRGEGRFKILNQEYAEQEKGGRRLSNLELEGDLKDSYKVEPFEESFLRIGHEGNQVPKADGHNQISSKAKDWAKDVGFPKRRYIPDTGQKYDAAITNRISSIIQTYKSISPANEITLDDLFDAGNLSTGAASSVTTNQTTTSVGFDINEDLIDALFADALARRG